MLEEVVESDGFLEHCFWRYTGFVKDHKFITINLLGKDSTTAKKTANNPLLTRCFTVNIINFAKVGGLSTKSG